jgi:hypothetical protein
MDKDRLPTGTWVDFTLHQLTLKAIPYYIVQKGNPASGLVLLKLNGLRGHCTLLMQERNFDSGALEWVHAMGRDIAEEFQADQYIQRAIARDPDLWVIEIEDPEMRNPFAE